MGSSIAWFSTEMRRTANSARVSRLSVSCDYGFKNKNKRKSCENQKIQCLVTETTYLFSLFRLKGSNVNTA